MGKVKIKNVTSDAIRFTDGSIMSHQHDQDCCENNYASFTDIDDLATEWEFELPLQFEKVNGYGFRFGNPNKMVFVPCYSEQNGYYSSDVDIYFNGEMVLNIECEEKIY